MASGASTTTVLKPLELSMRMRGAVRQWGRSGTATSRERPAPVRNGIGP